MFHPDVLRAPPDGGWQNPWLLDHGFASPGLSQALHPSLKTLMLEHNWNQNAQRLACNPLFVPIYPELRCAPYHFNHGLASSPATLFYDLSTSTLPNTAVQAGDRTLIEQTGYGLWSRDTYFGETGYLNAGAIERVDLSHHVLTTEGILGRDVLSR